MLHNRRLLASSRTEPNFFASESFPWLWGISECLVESLPMILPFLLAFGKSHQQVVPPIRNLRKFSLLHRHAGHRHQNHHSWSVETTHDTLFFEEPPYIPMQKILFTWLEQLQIAFGILDALLFLFGCERTRLALRKQHTHP